MDNNMNMQQPMGQPMGQQMGQQMGQPMGQPMYQQPMYQQPMGQPMQQPMGQPMQQPMGQPMQQPMGQPMYQQPMGQPMYNPMYMQPKKKNTGLIIGIISAISVLVIAAIVIVLVLVLGGGKNKEKLIGTWKSEDGGTFVFEEGNTGSVTYEGIKATMTWKLSGDDLTMTISYMGYEETGELEIEKLTDDKLILEDEDGYEQVLTRVK